MELDDRITIATPEGVAIEIVLAGLGSRFLARLLDSVIQVLVIIALLIGLGVADSSSTLRPRLSPGVRGCVTDWYLPGTSPLAGPGSRHAQ